ncbi:MAG: hypothetical protein HC900_05980 [Methylacidiphilales bacterium]|nr:hypothetical protein [Candidatus Methylacidiphilales bacterium]
MAANIDDLLPTASDCVKVIAQAEAEVARNSMLAREKDLELKDLELKDLELKDLELKDLDLGAWG